MTVMKDVKRDYRTSIAMLLRCIYESHRLGERPLAAFSLVQQYGRDAANKTHYLAPNWPNELIMDSILLDLMVVRDTETCLQLGRPRLTVCMDAATRTVLGYSITFGSVSLCSTACLLRRVNKNTRHRYQPRPHVSGDWDAWGLPGKMLLDRAPQYKSIPEPLFRTIKKRKLHKPAGGVPGNSYHFRQDGYDPNNATVTTISDLNALMHKHIISRNRHKCRAWRDGRLRLT